MKTLSLLALATVLSMRVYADPVLSDITTYEAYVIDEGSGQTLVSGPRWEWNDMVSQSLSTVAGPGRTIVIKCRDAAGKTIFGGAIDNADLTPPFSPFNPPDPSGQVTLLFYSENYTVSVFLNGIYYVGEMLMLPASDDPIVPTEQIVTLDIKPGSTENPFNTDAQGVLPVAIMGSAELDVSQIVPASIKLAGISPVRSVVTDLQLDGYADDLLHFRDQDIAGLLTGVTDGEVVALELSGMLQDGTPIKGTDSITVKVKKAKNASRPKTK